MAKKTPIDVGNHLEFDFLIIGGGVLELLRL